jgi:catechol 2,3-dioxygenase-like lactoylglutathione lyase family enzyme
MFAIRHDGYPTEAPMPAAFRPNSFDHVALWVDERDAIAEFAYANLGMHEIERTDTFTLIGVDAKEGKLTLFDADGPREPGVLSRIVLRVADLDGALAGLGDEVEVERDGDEARFDGPGGLRFALVQGEGLDYDLDHVVLRVPDPGRTASSLAGLGFAQRNGHLSVADRHVRLEAGDGSAAERPLLNHLALLVDSADDVREQAEQDGLEIAKVVDAANTLAVFVDGPDQIQVEYVEHKPGFSLV